MQVGKVPAPAWLLDYVLIKWWQICHLNQPESLV
jgi:hypothetical protein